MGCIIINHVMFSSKMFQLTFPLINAHGTSRDYMQTCVKIGAPYNGWSIHKISPSLWLIWALRTKCVYVPYGFPVGYCSILGFHIILCEIWVVLILNYWNDPRDNLQEAMCFLPSKIGFARVFLGVFLPTRPMDSPDIPDNVQYNFFLSVFTLFNTYVFCCLKKYDRIR
jgi:hypothetical protein